MILVHVVTIVTEYLMRSSSLLYLGLETNLENSVLLQALVLTIQI